jgi:hypothetical protein
MGGDDDEGPDSSRAIANQLAVRAENSFPTQIGTGQKAKERLSGDEPMRAADCIINGCRVIRSKHHQYEDLQTVRR